MESQWDDAALTAALQQPDAYPNPAPAIRVIETHISRVFLAGDFAYKVRKPVRFDFVDFSTAQARRDDCETELRLNRRFAPALYLDVVPIVAGLTPGSVRVGGSGMPIEHAVRMRRFDQQDLLSARIAADRLEPGHIDALARSIAAFHQEQPPAAHSDGFGTPARIDATLAECLGGIGRLAQATRTWRYYEADLEEHLQRLHAQVQSGAYRALPVRRQYIPKPDGKQRPLGIAALEDKIVQRAVVEVLNGICEQDFLGFSYGFRPGRSQHDALDALAVAITDTPVNWILDADIRSFFDSVSQQWLIRFMEHRIGDPRIIRLVRKWLRAGVLEDGEWSVSEEGTPQGAVISPLLANIYLHYVFDLWANRWRRREAKGNVIILRYADDVVVGFEHEVDARRFWDEMRQRFEEFSLVLHPDKTRLLEFGRYAAGRRQRRGLGRPETFSFLGFMYICGKSRRGSFLLHRKTRKDRMQAKLRQIKEQLRRRMHDSIPVQGHWLRQVVRGYFAYHAVPTNARALVAFRYHVTHLWRRALRRRSQKDAMTWARMTRLANDWLPKPRIQHPWPSERFAVNHPR
ncbi:putative RNA-directed DNA polymerase (plasmid) [Cupriavidus taiwanensis]|uniref:Putative RNA-directed DNA polymerase n=1 Tax=Cupriavidus taiwanensis TaxID=164546 RepID=A0A375I6Z2_9BURK|nr:group II intron reverse transcriptase/maturase [Cupriavidus taiwanensis]SPK70593.1 putative RNA-directed DNA polymerase [Cupriavidus taiwanensis]SPK77031.1 putative RNA-directed DNA polymerase [Cupriavidus taiwanensis]